MKYSSKKTSYSKMGLILFLVAFLLVPANLVQANTEVLDIVKIDNIIINETEPAQPTIPLLVDVKGHWAEISIMSLIENKIISGYPDGTFRPDNQITRAEFAVIIVKAFKLENKTGKIFNDTANHWAKDQIATAQAYGIVGGYNETTFGPNDPITREQMAVMIVKAAGITDVTGGVNFSDGEKISSWATSAIETAVSHKILTGYPDNTFGPQGNASRAEAATVIINALQK